MSKRSDYEKIKSYPGLYVKTDPKTKVRTYIARIRIGGFNTEQIVGRSDDLHKTNAQIAFQRRMELINEYKQTNSIRKSDNPIVEKFAEEFLEHKKNTISKGRLDNYKTFLKKHVPKKVKQKRLKDINLADLQSIVNKMLENGYKPSRSKIVKEFFSPLYKYAIELDMTDKNPAANISFPKFDNNRYFLIDKETGKRLYEAIQTIENEIYRLMFHFLLQGRRKGEILSLEWDNVSLKDKKYVIISEKNKIRRRLSFLFTEEMISILERQDNKSGLVFKSPKTGKMMSDIPKRLWNQIRNEVGVPNMRIHDFRHWIGFMNTQNGIPLEVTMRTLGHTNIKTTQKYSNMTEEMAKQGSDHFLKSIADYA